MRTADSISMLRNVTVAELGYDGYQREIDKPWVQSIAEDWTLSIFSEPRVIHYTDGRVPAYEVVDGQHTVEGFRLACQEDGLDETKELITVKVIGTDLSQQDAANLFVAINQGRRPVVVYERYKAGLIGKVDWCEAIDRVAATNGLEVKRRVTVGKDEIAGVSNLKTIVMKGSESLLDFAIQRFIDVWPNTMDGRFNPFMVEGAAMLIRDLRLQGWSDTRIETAFDRLKAVSPKVVENNALIVVGRGAKGIKAPYVWSQALTKTLRIKVGLSPTWGDKPRAPKP